MEGFQRKVPMLPFPNYSPNKKRKVDQPTDFALDGYNQHAAGGLRFVGAPFTAPDSRGQARGTQTCQGERSWLGHRH